MSANVGRSPSGPPADQAGEVINSGANSRVWSVLGMVIAVPVLVVIRVLSEHVPGWEKFGNFLAGEEPPAIEDEDEEEAREIVESGAPAEDEEAARAVTRPLVADDGRN